MEKVIVSVAVPSLNMCFDILLPKTLEVKTIVHLLVEAITGLTNREYSSSNEELLCWKEKEIVLNEKKLLADYDIKNGDHLFLY